MNRTVNGDTEAVTGPEAFARTSGGSGGSGARRSAILLNAKAGALHATAGVEDVRKMVEEFGIGAEVIGTETPEQMCATIKQLISEGVERIGVAGGDGTVHLATQIIAGTKAALGIIPQGTANNFATALRLPQDLPSALRILQDGVIRSVDLGKVNDEYFTEAAGVGLFADALALYGAGTNKNFFRGLYAMFRVIFPLRARRLRLTLDGETHVERAVMCVVANSYRMGAAMPVAPGAKVTDGQFDVVIVGNLSLGELLPYYRAFRAQLHLTLPKVSSMRAKEVKIESARGMNVHCDDQVVGTTPVRIITCPGALNVLVDRL